MTFVGPGFTRKPPKYERFIRPTGLRQTKAHVTHPELKATFCLEILGVKKNPNGVMYSSLGVLTKGTIIEVGGGGSGLVGAAGCGGAGAGTARPGELGVVGGGGSRRKGRGRCCAPEQLSGSRGGGCIQRGHEAWRAAHPGGLLWGAWRPCR
jgi:ribosomal protein S8E